jgi:hypothetical protein
LREPPARGRLPQCDQPPCPGRAYQSTGNCVILDTGEMLDSERGSMDPTERLRAQLTLSDQSELRALRDFLRWAAPGARVLQIQRLDMLTLLAPAGALLAAVKLLPEFLRPRDTVTITITIDTTSVTLTATNMADVLPTLKTLIS